MILCDSEIWAALKHGQIKIDPEPARDDYTTTAVDLHLGETDFKRWKKPGKGVSLIIDPSQSGFYRDAADFLEDAPREPDGSVIIYPNEFLLALTKERVELPEQSRIAARVEGKSSLARIGLIVHLTAPTIHSGFKGNITLEIKNHGDFPIKLCPGMPVCQLIFESVFGTPSVTMRGMFQEQTSVKGKN